MHFNDKEAALRCGGQHASLVIGSAVGPLVELFMILAVSLVFPKSTAGFGIFRASIL